MKHKTVYFLMAGVALGLALELSGFVLAPWFIAAFVTGYIADTVYWQALRGWQRWRRPAHANAAAIASWEYSTTLHADEDDDAGDHDS